MGIAGLTLAQPRGGYRYSIDPFLLAAFVQPRRGERVLDVGAGVGVISLILARRFPSLHLVALEIQEDLARHAGENARANRLAGRCFVLRGDLRDAPSLFPPEYFHRIVANPPFRSPGSGRESPDPSRALARHEAGFTLEGLAASASKLLRFGGALDFIHLAARLPEIIRILSAHHLEAKTLRFVSPFPESPSRMVLLSARKGGRPGLVVRAPLAVHERPGIHTPEVAAALSAARPRIRAQIQKTSKE